MYIDPKIAIDKGWIKRADLTNDLLWSRANVIQPNAIDFTLDKLFTINSENVFVISEEGKEMRGGTELAPVPNRSDMKPFWTLTHGVYDGMSNFVVDLPEGVACELIIRSTFNRNGIFLTSGLYDSGFQGHIGFAIHNRCGDAKIGQGTRIGQIKFVASDRSGMYAGGYNHGEGTYDVNGK